MCTADATIGRQRIHTLDGVRARRLRLRRRTLGRSRDRPRPMLPPMCSKNFAEFVGWPRPSHAFRRVSSGRWLASRARGLSEPARTSSSKGTPRTGSEKVARLRRTTSVLSAPSGLKAGAAMRPVARAPRLRKDRRTKASSSGSGRPQSASAGLGRGSRVGRKLPAAGSPKQVSSLRPREHSIARPIQRSLHHRGCAIRRNVRRHGALPGR